MFYLYHVCLILEIQLLLQKIICVKLIIAFTAYPPAEAHGRQYVLLLRHVVYTHLWLYQFHVWIIPLDEAYHLGRVNAGEVHVGLGLHARHLDKVVETLAVFPAAERVVEPVLRAITMPYRTSVCVLVEARHVKSCLFQHSSRIESDITFFYHGYSSFIGFKTSSRGSLSDHWTSEKKLLSTRESNSTSPTEHHIFRNFTGFSL